MFKSIIQSIWRAGGATIIGAAIAAAAATPWGMVATPILMGISKGIKQYYAINHDNVPAWVGWLPF